MLKKEKILLKFLVTNYKVGNRIDTSKIYNTVNLTKAEINSICDLLSQKGVISDYTFFKNGRVTFKLTYSTIDYWNTYKSEFKKFLITSIIIPIIVGCSSSVVAAVIIALINV